MLLLTLRETYTLNRLSSFQNLRRKGGKFYHRPEQPEVLLHHCLLALSVTRLTARAIGVAIAAIASNSNGLSLSIIGLLHAERDIVASC